MTKLVPEVSAVSRDTNLLQATSLWPVRGLYIYPQSSN